MIAYWIRKLRRWHESTKTIVEYDLRQWSSVGIFKPINDQPHSLTKEIGLAVACAVGNLSWWHKSRAKKAKVAVVITTMLVVSVALSVVGCSRPSMTEPNFDHQLASDISKWSIPSSDSINMPATPSPDPAGVWSIDVPTRNHGLLGYIIGRVGGAVRPGDAIVATFTVEMSNDAVFAAPLDGGDGYGTVTIYFQDGYGNRWWAGRTTTNLANGAANVRVPFQWGEWTGVAGQTNEGEFTKGISFVDAVGVTFGGEYSYGHGVQMAAGTAKVRCVDYRIERGQV